MCLNKVFFSLLITICITSCAFIPATSNKQSYYQKCDDMVTKKLTLETIDITDLESCDDKDLDDCLVETGIFSSLSYIASGSIVLLGNTLHWSEYKIRC